MSKECKQCGAEMVTNPKTGNIFCSNKCWTKENSKLDTKDISESLGRIEGMLEEIHEELFEESGPFTK